jgi:beta-lactam-binding protein with PASTA domain
VPAEELRPVPGVVGATVEVARERLETDGFLVRIIPVGATPPGAEIVEEPPGKCANGEVVEQDPPPDEDARRAATVVLTASGC